MKRTKTSLLKSALALLLCVSMLIGSTFAWFTDSVTSKGNIIQSGNLNIEMYWTDDLSSDVWHNVEDAAHNTIFSYDNWEPGYTDVKYIKLVNKGNLALNYKLTLTPQGSVGKLAEVINVYFADSAVDVKSPEDLSKLGAIGLLNNVMNGGAPASGTLLAANQQSPLHPSGEVIMTIAMNMLTTAGNEYQGKDSGDFTITALATQASFEQDSFGSDYDSNAAFPSVITGGSVSTPVTAVDGKVPAGGITMTGDGISAFVPAGAKMAAGADALTLSVTPMEHTTSNITVVNKEILIPVDVHISGLAADNTVPVVIDLGEVLPKYMNMGNYHLYHVENGANSVMTLVDNEAALTEHNRFTYDPLTGVVKVAMATFSEVAVVADTTKAWEGNYDYSWYTNAVAPADGEGNVDYTIANADQLAAFSAIVGGMNGQTQDSFAGKTVKLISNINLGDSEKENNTSIIFYPIGYYNSEGTYERTNTAITSGLRNFEGTFDGNGHSITNFYQNTWEMKGDHNWYSPEEQYYRDGMGLFGRVYGGTVKNLTVSNFSSDGEITTTGCIAAYADGATFENIAIFNCNPRVYNIGNGGIVGCVGWYAKDANLKTTFKNITVDNSNKISALWGSYDVACGGVVGQYYPTSGQTSAGSPKNAGVYFENCHISAQMDVYNDVCANYQYYAYRYTGMLIGSVRENETIDGHSYPKMDGITATGCTVHFGDWNDYYYCELVANSLASYTHDHQFSRLEQVKAVNGKVVTYLNGTTETVTGTRNFVVVNGEHASENATCYHFKNGEVYNHTDAGTETVGGVEVLKEDKQHIYLEFNNLVTGYGWGVTTKGVDDLEGVTILDREVANSEAKFEKADTAKDSYTTDSTVTIGELFKAADIEDKNLEIKGDKVQVTVSPVGEDSTVTGTYAANTTDWTQGTLTFNGLGTATITITDYYFCTPTTINLNITERQAEVKFETKFKGDFLYRVGNADNSPVALGTLFEEITANTVVDSGVWVTVEKINEEMQVSGTFTANTADWAKGTIQFSGTGIVKVTITDDDYCTPTVLYLEVVDAVNATGATSATANNVVLLNDVPSASNITVSNGYTFYGNGFALNYTGDGSYRSAAVSYGFVTLESGTLDNVQIKCKVFPKSYVFTVEMQAGSDGRYPYGYSAVVASNGSVISNSYIYGARNNVQIGSGDVTIDNTVLECGSLANIHCKGTSADTVTLNNVTTIQYQTTDDFGDSAKVLGFGVLVGTNESTSNATIKLTGDFKQYNWVTSANTSVSNTYAKTAISEALKVTDYQYTFGGETAVNMGIVVLNEVNCDISDERTNKDSIPYKMQNISMSGYTGQVSSIAKGSSAITAESRYNAKTDGVIPYTPSAQKVISPEVSHSGAADSSLTINTSFNKKWITTFTADLDNITGGSYDFKFSDLVVKKHGKELSYTVKDSSGNTVDKTQVITLNQLYTSEYTLIVTDNIIYDSNAQLSGKTVTHEMPFVLYATKTSIDPPKFDGIGDGTSGAIRLVSSSGGNWRPAYPALQGVSVTYWSASEGKSKTINLESLTEQGTISGQKWTYTCDDFMLTITGGPVHTTTSYVLSPMIATRDGEKILYFAAANKDNTTGTTARLICLEYVFTDKNASTTVGQCTTYSNGIATVQYANLPEFSWSSFQKGTVEEVSSGSTTPCVTPDTLITLADGTQKRIDQVTYEDQLLVWNFYEGKYDVAPIAIIFDHGADNNTVIALNFSDGTTVKAVNMHQFYDANLNELVTINKDTVKDYVGHKFAKHSGNTTNFVKLVSYSVSDEYVEAWGIMTAEHYNIITEGMISADFDLKDVQLFNYFEVGDDMKFDETKMQADIEKYGLYTYNDFADYLTPEQFVAFNVQYFKIPVGKGLYTYEGILDLIEQYLK